MLVSVELNIMLIIFVLIEVNFLEALEMKNSHLDVKCTLVDLTDFHCYSWLRVRKDLLEKKEHMEKRDRKECREHVTCR